jgi:hypothetical protein
MDDGTDAVFGDHLAASGNSDRKQMESAIQNGTAAIYLMKSECLYRILTSGASAP